jgi:HAD superfamily hydrolase (TIGR01549 family)
LIAIQGVIFDLGHTLMYLDGTWPQVFALGAVDLAAFLKAQVPDLDGKAFAEAFLGRRREGFARAKESMREVTAEESMQWTFARFGYTDPDRALLRGALDAFFAGEVERWRAYPEAEAVLGELSGRGLRLGMFSNATDDPLIQGLVDRLGLRHWLDPALTSAGTGIRKPDPAAFDPILEAWGLPPESVVMVGDTLDADVLGAQRAGLRSVWLRSRPDARQEGDGYDLPIYAGRPSPHATIERLADLPRCLEQLRMGN